MVEKFWKHRLKWQIWFFVFSLRQNRLFDPVRFVRCWFSVWKINSSRHWPFSSSKYFSSVLVQHTFTNDFSTHISINSLVLAISMQMQPLWILDNFQEWQNRTSICFCMQKPNTTTSKKNAHESVCKILDLKIFTAQKFDQRIYRFRTKKKQMFENLWKIWNFSNILAKCEKTLSIANCKAMKKTWKFSNTKHENVQKLCSFWLLFRLFTISVSSNLSKDKFIIPIDCIFFSNRIFPKIERKGEKGRERPFAVNGYFSSFLCWVYS